MGDPTEDGWTWGDVVRVDGPDGIGNYPANREALHVAVSEAERLRSLLVRLWEPDSVWPNGTSDALLDEWRAIVEETS